MCSVSASDASRVCTSAYPSMRACSCPRSETRSAVPGRQCGSVGSGTRVLRRAGPSLSRTSVRTAYGVRTSVGPASAPMSAVPRPGGPDTTLVTMLVGPGVSESRADSRSRGGAVRSATGGHHGLEVDEHRKVGRPG